MNKNISFAQLIRNKPQAQEERAAPRLRDFVQKWQLHPEEEYTLCFREPQRRSHHSSNHQQSRNTNSHSAMFDSWIHNQSLNGRNNKENISTQQGKYEKQIEIGKASKLSTKTMADLICQNVMKQQGQSKGSVQSMKTIPQKEHLKHEMNKITERKRQEISNLFREEENSQQSVKLQDLIEGTEGIHTEIASIAKLYCKQASRGREEEKKSIEEYKQHQTFENVFGDDRENEREREDQAQKKRWEQAKNMLNGYLDKFKKRPAQPKKEQTQQPINSEIQSDLHIGFSFAVNNPSTNHQFTYKQLTIEHIHEAKSEMVSKAVEDSHPFDHSNKLSRLDIPSQNIQNIQSVQYRGESDGRVIQNVPNSTLPAKLITSQSSQSIHNDSLGRIESRSHIGNVHEIEDIICRQHIKSEPSDDTKPSIPFSTKVSHIPKSSNQKLSIISSSKGKLGQQKSNKASPSVANLIQKQQIVTTAFNIFPPPDKNEEKTLALHQSGNESRSLLINPSKKSIKDVRSSIITPIPAPLASIPYPSSSENTRPMFFKTEPARTDNLPATSKPVIVSKGQESSFPTQLQCKLETIDIRKCQIRYITSQHQTLPPIDVPASSQVHSSSEFVFDI